MEIWEPKLPGTLWATSGLLGADLPFLPRMMFVTEQNLQSYLIGEGRVTLLLFHLTFIYGTRR